MHFLKLAPSQRIIVSAVVDSSRRYWRNIIDRLNKLEALMEQEVGTPGCWKLCRPTSCSTRCHCDC